MRACPVHSHPRRLRRFLPGVAAAALGLLAQDFRVAEFRLVTEGAVVRQPAAVDRYYRLLRGDRLMEVSLAVDIQLGATRDTETPPVPALCCALAAGVVTVITLAK